MSSLASSTSSGTTSSSSSTATFNPNNNSLASATLRSPTLYVFVAFTGLLLIFGAKSFITHRRRRLHPATEDDLREVGHALRRHPAEKPKLWEVWVDDLEQLHDSSHSGGSDAENLGKGEGKWEEILPVSAIMVSSNAPNPISLSNDKPTGSVPITQPERQHTPSRSITSRLLGRRPFTTPPLPPPDVPSRERIGSETENDSEMVRLEDVNDIRSRSQEEKRLQVTVLISMPTPNSRRMSGSDTSSNVSIKGQGKVPVVDESDEPDIPEVVFGVVETNFRA